LSAAHQKQVFGWLAGWLAGAVLWLLVTGTLRKSVILLSDFVC
jgi:hypothetical protein